MGLRGIVIGRSIPWWMPGLVAMALSALWFIFYSTGPIDSVASYRGIDGTPQKWFNGHLGLFFKIDMLGAVHLFLLPVFIWESLKKKSFFKNSVHLVWGFWISFILVSALAYFNYRYWITFSLPVVAIVFKYLYENLRSKSDKVLIWAIALLLCVQGFNIFAKRIYNKLNTNSITSETGLPQKVDKPVGASILARLTFKPNLVFDFFNKNQVEGAVLLNGLPMFYTHCRQKAFMYFAERDIVYSSIGKSHLLDINTSSDALPRLSLQDLNIQYVLSSSSHNQMFKDFKKWIDENCVLLIQEGDIILYRIEHSHETRKST